MPERHDRRWRPASLPALPGLPAHLSWHHRFVESRPGSLLTTYTGPGSRTYCNYLPNKAQGHMLVCEKKKKKIEANSRSDF